MNLLETETNLQTPEFMGVEAEKINALEYWTTLVRHLHELNSRVIEINNKVAILESAKELVETLLLDVTNATAHPAVDKETGSTSMKQDGCPIEDAPKVVDLATPEEGVVGESTLSYNDQLRVLVGTKFVGRQTYFPTKNDDLSISDLRILAGIHK